MRYLIKNARLLDGMLDENGQMPVREGMAVVVEDNKIAEICETADIAADTESNKHKFERVFDLHGSYLLPGLINNHVHLAAEGSAPRPREKPVNYKMLFNVLTKVPGCRQVYIHLQKKRALNQLLSGCTTIRVVGGVLDFDGVVRDCINAGRMDGPRILTSNMAVSVPGGHFAGSLACEATSPEDAVRWVDKIYETKPDFIKVMITGGVMDAVEVGEPGALRMSPEIVKATVDRAHELGLQAVAHVESTEGVKVALESGIDSVEHGASLSQDLIAKFKETGAVVTATISPAIPYALFDLDVSHCGEVGHINGRALMESMITCYKQCVENDITMGLGTDTGCPFISHYNFWRELHYFKKYVEVSADRVLNMATLGNAVLLGLDDKIGSIEVGKNAEMIVAANNPLEDFRNLSQLEYVFKGSTIIENPQPNKSEKIDSELDKFM